FEQTVLDPFCGTGVIMQEAWLMGYDVAGTDIDQRMVDYSQTNVAQWLAGKFSRRGLVAISLGDATNYSWDKRKPYIVASETYLGRPFTAKPPDKLLDQTSQEVNLILKKFLKNIHAQLPAETRLCLAVPAWQSSPNQFRHLALIDQLDQIGYNRVRFEHSADNQLVYCRPDQLVARELLVLIRK
ncbi:MAG: TRM11 family SAM-dependent methyltransferase, partial [Candidatus Saccharimonadales bacterium]